MTRFRVRKRYTFFFFSILFFSLPKITNGEKVVHGEYTTKAPYVRKSVIDKFFSRHPTSGNRGSYYLNMDRGHSTVRVSDYPKLGTASLLSIFPEKYRLSSGEAYSRDKHVIIGNASLGTTTDSRGKQVRGSLANNYHIPLTSPEHSIQRLYENYRQNRVMVFPAVHDYGPGLNGRPQYGDYFPANTPYVISSVGTSGTDRAFVRAWIHTIASFRSPVKGVLKHEGLLMPTLQMIFRISNKNVSGIKDYLTGKAHPSAFYGGLLDMLAMGKMANSISSNTIPPMIQLRVLSEDQPIPGIDFYESEFKDDKIFTTPSAISRVFRSRNKTKKITVSAQYSYDINNRPLTFEWVVLRGNKHAVTITPTNDDNSVVEIQIPYFEKYKDSDYQVHTNRTDIGVFANNGVFYSAPGFISVVTLPNELRTYDEQGRILEIGYNIGNTIIGYNAQEDGKKTISSHYDITNWKKALRTVLHDHSNAIPATLLQHLIPDNQRNTLEEAEKEIEDVFSKAQGKKRYTSRQKKSLYDILTKERKTAKNFSAKTILETALNTLKSNVNLYIDHHLFIEKHMLNLHRKERSILGEYKERLLHLGILQYNNRYTLHSIREGNSPVEERLTSYERNQLEWFHLMILSHLFYPDFLRRDYIPNATDIRLSLPKSWYRDVYHYDKKGPAGWSRYQKEGIVDYASDGRLSDGKTVTYVRKQVQGHGLSRSTTFPSY